MIEFPALTVAIVNDLDINSDARHPRRRKRLIRLAF
jgi:hypothetical protein